jgi:hypothetical protein
MIERSSPRTLRASELVATALLRGIPRLYSGAFSGPDSTDPSTP